MENEPKYLFMVLLGGTPPGRLTEQHDIFFGIGRNIKELVPEMKASWPGVKIHIDAWQKISIVDGHSIEIVSEKNQQKNKLYFINLGGYKPNEFEEFHHKMLVVAPSMAAAIKKAKATTFYHDFNGEDAAASHIDDKYGVDIDEIFLVKDILANRYPAFHLNIQPAQGTCEPMQIGYMRL